MAGKEEVIQTTFKADELAGKYDAFTKRLKAVCADFKVPPVDLTKIAKLMGDGKKAVNFVAGWDGKQLFLTIEHGSSVLVRSRQDVLDEPNVSKRRRMTAGLVTLKLMTQSDAGQLDRATLTPDRRALDAAKREVSDVETRIRDTEMELLKLQKERSDANKKLKAAQAH